MKKSFLILSGYAQNNNISFNDAARRYLQSNAIYHSAVKDYIVRAGRVPDVGLMAQAKQAGFLILEEAGDQLQEFLNLEPGMIPTKFRKLNFYGLANKYPTVFVACVFLASEEEFSSSNFSLDPRKALEKVKKAAKQAADWAGDAVRDLADKGKDLIGEGAVLAKKAAFAPFRGPFLVVVRFNVFNFARRLDAAILKDRQRVKNMWEDDLGGDFAQLVSAVNLGKKEMPILPGKSQTFGRSYSTAEPTSTAAAVAAATPIIAKVSAVLTAIGVAVDQGIELKDKIKNEADEIIGTGEEFKKEVKTMLPESGEVKTPFGNVSFGFTNNKADIIKIVIAAVVVVSLVYLIKRK